MMPTGKTRRDLGERASRLVLGQLTRSSIEDINCQCTSARVPKILSLADNKRYRLCNNVVCWRPFVSPVPLFAVTIKTTPGPPVQAEAHIQQREQPIMARLPYLTRADLPPEHQDLLTRDIALFRLMTHSPGGARAFSGLGGYIRNKSKLDGRLRELAILQVGWLARSPYEWAHHVKIGHDFGVSDEDIQALIDDTAGKQTTLDASARNVLRAAREMTVQGAASAETFTALQGILSTEHLTDLVLTISFYCAVVRFLATMQVDVEPEYMTYLERWPLPKD